MEDLQRSFNQLGHYSGTNLGAGNPSSGDASDSLYEEVDVLSPVKADSASASYLSGVGDLMTSCGRGSAPGRMRVPAAPFSPRAPAKARHVFAAEELVEVEEEEVEVVVADDNDRDAQDNTEVEYYEEDEDVEEVEIEEIELDDELYEEMVLPDKSGGGGERGSRSQPPRPSSKRSDDANTAPTTSALDEDDDDDDLLPGGPSPSDPLPSREEVAEAITYIVRQEKVVEYGLMTKRQVDEMNDLPLEEMVEIMKHFEICDNNNATIQWDLVLAMINPDYSPDAEDPAGNDEDDDDGGGPQSPGGRSRASSSGKAAARRAAAPAPAPAPAPAADEDEDDDEEDGLSVIHPLPGLPGGSEGDAASAGSYSLEVGADPSEAGVVSNLTAADYATDRLDDDGGTEYVEETLHGSIVSIDPLIRASYTKSMVELKKSHHSSGEGGGA